MKTKQKRPKFLNLLRIHLPVTGVNSIAHRISGFLLFLAIPLLIIAFNMSLRDADSFQELTRLVQSNGSKLIFTVLTWAMAHHLLAGIRFLLTELDVGTSLQNSRRAAWFINIAAVVISIVIAYRIWL